jgi:hypothetical protein
MTKIKKIIHLKNPMKKKRFGSSHINLLTLQPLAHDLDDLVERKKKHRQN